MSNFYQKLCDAIGAASVREQEPMSAHTTFRAGGPARYFVTPEGVKELAAVLAAAGFVVHFKWCRCPHCGDRLRVTDWLMRMPKMCPKCHKELN